MTQTQEQRRIRLQEFLQGEKRRLWNELREELFEKLGEGLHAQYDIPQDLGERGVLNMLENTGLALADIRKEPLLQMEEALAKLATGSYGICGDCGKNIDEARLQVAPYAVYCVGCQKKREGPATQQREAL